MCNNGNLDENVHISSTYSGWIDLFGWGTSGWNSGAVCYQPWSTSITESHYYTGGSWENGLTGAYAEADWAWHNAISNGGNAVHQWRTLTSAEWDYLLFTRTNASAKLSPGRVVGVAVGLIILPDSWVLPSGCTFNAGVSWDYTRNSYTIAQWAQMEAEGAVFLPETRCRNGSGMNYDCLCSPYWSSTPCDEYSAFVIYFPGISNDIALRNISRSQGYAVRPVQDQE